VAFDCKSYPSEFSDTFTLTSTGYQTFFGFNAALLRVRNLGPTPMYLSLSAKAIQGGATTSASLMSSGGDQEWYDVGAGMAGVALMSTAASGAVVCIDAWG
jgi:hypothetical protein